MEKIYQVAPADLTGDIEDFPIEVVQKMVEHQYEQTGECCVEVFCDRRDASKNQGGFTWEFTNEGWEFWSNVIGSRRFALFFESYPQRANGEFKLPYQKKLGLTRLQKWYLSHRELFPTDIEYMSVKTLMSCMTPRELAKAYEELNLYPYFEYTGNNEKELRFLGILRNVKREIELACGNLKRFRSQELSILMYGHPKDALLRAIIGWIKKNPLVAYHTKQLAFKGCDITIRVRRLYDDIANLEWEYKEDLGVKKSNACLIYLINGVQYEIY